MSKLREILQEEALTEINRILTEADSRAETLILEARSKASGRVEGFRKKAEADLRAALRAAKSASELTLSVARTRAREQGVAQVKEKALAALEQLASKPNYVKILEALAEEALKTVKEAEALIVHPDDRDRVGPWAKQKGLELRTDPTLQLGVRIMARGGPRSVENTLPGRVQRAWENLASGVAARLWGESQ